jgi:predicted tellurium resistance membrane protein TerC
MERAAFILLIVGAVMLFAFTLSVDFSAITQGYSAFVIGAVMVIAGLVMLYRCEMKRTKMLE